MRFRFLDRQHELELLTDLWNSKAAEFLILYGRRRVGKTALLTEWIQRTSQSSLYWVASPTSSALQLRSFSQAIYNFANPSAAAPDTFTYATWEQAFQQIANLAERERF